jgi:hypothetical protein
MLSIPADSHLSKTREIRNSGMLYLAISFEKKSICCPIPWSHLDLLGGTSISKPKHLGIGMISLRHNILVLSFTCFCLIGCGTDHQTPSSAVQLKTIAAQAPAVVEGHVAPGEKDASAAGMN